MPTIIRMQREARVGDDRQQRGCASRARTRSDRGAARRAARMRALARAHLAAVEPAAAGRGTSGAIRSTTFCCSASSADRLTASRTAARPSRRCGRAAAPGCGCRRRRRASALGACVDRRSGALADVVALRVLARHADRDRRGGAEIGAGRHRGDVAGVEDVGAGAGGARAARARRRSPPAPARRGCP